jgi:glycosyltransferase involved in cell wall biosynthesis
MVPGRKTTADSTALAVIWNDHAYFRPRAKGTIVKVSVVMITYNHEKFIAQAIESVLAQKVGFDYEIVIGEDCSKDNTRALVMNFQRRYPDRIVPLLRDSNMGAMRNFAETIAACRGEYLAFLEGDDYWTLSDKLQKQVDLLDSRPEVALCCHRVRFLAEQNPASDESFPSIPPGTYQIDDLLRNNFVMTCSTVLRRSLITSFPKWIFTLRLADWPFFAIVAAGGGIELMDEIMADYRLHSGSTWSSLPQVVRIDETSRMLKLLDEHLNHRFSNVIRQTITDPYLQLAEQARADGLRLATTKHLLRFVQNGGLRRAKTLRTFGGLVTYTIIGRHYKKFSRAKMPRT